jgi:hypothetical protein
MMDVFDSPRDNSGGMISGIRNRRTVPLLNKKGAKSHRKGYFNLPHVRPGHESSVFQP